MKIENLIQHLFPSLTWRISSNEKIIYLTFDDGPIPEVTPWVLKTLNEFNARATFFLVGENVRKHPELLTQVLNSKNSIGNHTMNHLNGWMTTNKKYYSDIAECDKLVGSKMFRPPYGKIRFTQTWHLRKKYKIYMWDVLSKDYDKNKTGEECFDIVKNKTRNGSIIVFHDSLKAEERLRVALPLTLKHFSERGFSFEAL